MKSLLLVTLLLMSGIVFADDSDLTFTYNQVTSQDSDGNSKTQDCQTTCQNNMCNTYCN